MNFNKQAVKDIKNAVGSDGTPIFDQKAQTYFDEKLSPLLLEDSNNLPASDVIDTIAVMILTQKWYLPKYSYKILKTGNTEFLINGTTRINYNDFSLGDDASGYDDVRIKDFNAELPINIAENFIAKSNWHSKVKVPDNGIYDFNSTNGVLGFVMAIVETNLHNLQKRLAYEMHAKVIAEATIVDVVTTDDQIVNEAEFEQFTNYTDTSRKHVGVGNTATAGEITLNNPAGDPITITPEKFFASNEFHRFVIPSYNTRITYDQDALFFNYLVTKKPLKSNETFNPAISSEVDITYIQDSDNMIINSVLTYPTGTVAFWIHEDVLKPFFHFQESTLTNRVKLFSVSHVYWKYDIYKRKDAPILIFTKTPPVAKQNYKDADIIKTVKLYKKDDKGNFVTDDKGNRIVSGKVNYVPAKKLTNFKSLTTINKKAKK